VEARPERMDDSIRTNSRYNRREKGSKTLKAAGDLGWEKDSQKLFCSRNFIARRDNQSVPMLGTCPKKRGVQDLSDQTGIHSEKKMREGRIKHINRHKFLKSNKKKHGRQSDRTLPRMETIWTWGGP